MNANVTLTVAEPIPALAEPRSMAMIRKRRSVWKRRSVLFVAIVLVAAGASGAAWMAQGPKAAAAPVTAAVARGNVLETVLATGTLQANTLVSVGAQVSGTIKTVGVKLGDTVKAGQVIAAIDSLTQENKVKAAKAALAIVEAQKAGQQVAFDKADKAADRAQSLMASKQLSQADLDTAAAARDSAAAQLKASDAQIQQATLNVDSATLDLSRTIIAAPIDGTVVAILVDEGQTVSAAQTAPTIVKIADLDSMIIRAKISEADVTRVQPGQKVTFTVLGDATPIQATLASIEPAPTSIESDAAATDTAIYYNGVFTVPNPDHKLRISMTAQVTIVLGEARNVLTVPSSALKPAGPATVARVYDAATGSTATKPVKVGLNNKVTAEIVAGLAESERVVTGNAAAGAAAGAATPGAAPVGLAGGRPAGGFGGFGGGPGGG
jgi:macrolide-specific efflux system membrane fusion protein